MKTKIIFKEMLLGVVIMLLWSFNYLTSSKAPHHGKVKNNGFYNIEVKNDYPYLFAYLLDKNLNPIVDKEIYCHTMFYFPNNTKMNVAMKRHKEDGFETELSTNSFSSFRIRFYVHGKMVSQQFENDLK